MNDRFTHAGLHSEMKKQKPFCDPLDPRIEAGATCSFCHKSEHEVQFMLLAAVSAVCDECIELHYRILGDFRESNQGPEAPQSGADEGESSKGRAGKRRDP